MDIWNQYQKLKVVGRGAFGRAILCRRKKDNALVVIKELQQESMSEEDRKSSINEIRVLCMLRHPNIIGYFDSFSVGGVDPEKQNREDNNKSPVSPIEEEMDQGTVPGLMIVMEYADGGTLFDFLKDQKDLLPEVRVISLFCQIALAIHHIHSHNILHRDLKTNNIMISGTGDAQVLKIGDFGISKVLTSKTKADTVVGTPSYLSPELCEGRPYNVKSDIWALGCVLYEIACLRRVFEASNLPALVMKIMKGDIEPLPNQYSPQLSNLTMSMLRLDPNQRPDMNYILSLSYLQPYLLDTQISIGRVNVIEKM